MRRSRRWVVVRFAPPPDPADDVNDHWNKDEQRWVPAHRCSVYSTLAKEMSPPIPNGFWLTYRTGHFPKRCPHPVIDDEGRKVALQCYLHRQASRWTDHTRSRPDHVLGGKRLRRASKWIKAYWKVRYDEADRHSNRVREGRDG